MADEKKGFLLRLPPQLLDELRRWAEQEMRSVNGQIEWLLRDALAKRGRPVNTTSRTNARRPRDDK